MKKIYLSAFCMFFASTVYGSNTNPTYLEEMYTLGTVSGQGLACKSKKYHQFELLARAIVVGKAPNKELQEQGMARYNTGKADAFMAVEDIGFADCAETLQAFDNQPIFKSVLYSDGRVKLADGTIIKPRKSYDASKLYTKDREAFIKADRAYKQYMAEAQKNLQSQKKVPLHDSSYQKMANEFAQ